MVRIVSDCLCPYRRNRAQKTGMGSNNSFSLATCPLRRGVERGTPPNLRGFQYLGGGLAHRAGRSLDSTRTN
jgi:hypothetical protein